MLGKNPTPQLESSVDKVTSGTGSTGARGSLRIDVETTAPDVEMLDLNKGSGAGRRDDATDVDKEQQGGPGDDVIEIQDKQQGGSGDNAIEIDEEQGGDSDDDAIVIDEEQQGGPAGSEIANDRTGAEANDNAEDGENSNEELALDRVNVSSGGDESVVDNTAALKAANDGNVGHDDGPMEVDDGRAHSADVDDSNQTKDHEGTEHGKDGQNGNKIVDKDSDGPNNADEDETGGAGDTEDGPGGNENGDAETEGIENAPNTTRVLTRAQAAALAKENGETMEVDQGQEDPKDQDKVEDKQKKKNPNKNGKKGKNKGKNKNKGKDQDKDKDGGQSRQIPMDAQTTVKVMPKIIWSLPILDDREPEIPALPEDDELVCSPSLYTHLDLAHRHPIREKWPTL